jgi:hypothetical protein
MGNEGLGIMILKIIAVIIGITVIVFSKRIGKHWRKYQIEFIGQDEKVVSERNQVFWAIGAGSVLVLFGIFFL